MVWQPRRFLSQATESILTARIGHQAVSACLLSVTQNGTNSQTRRFFLVRPSWTCEPAQGRREVTRTKRFYADIEHY